ncbi:MAG: hypothetical protein JNL82_42330 [Myxococcales bacterium]|nr:hypothetical protein [Myxococcales bacterium]
MTPRVLLAALLALAPASASAELADHEFTPVHLQQLVGLDDFTFDTDWFPMDAALQLRLVAHAGNSVQIVMPGAATYDWDATQIYYTGTPDAGTFNIDVGLTLDAKIRFDVLGQQWESDIIGPYDYAVITGAVYTPYLLFNNAERPVVIDDQTDPVTFVEVPVTPDIIVASGHLDIDAFLIIHAELACVQIETATSVPSAQLVVITEEGQMKPLDAGPGPFPDPLLAEGTLVCTLQTEPTVVLKPTLVMTILGQDFEIADIEIPISIPPFDDTIRFDPRPLSFPRPPAPAGSDSSSGDGSSDSDGDSNTGGDSEAVPTSSAGDDSGEASGTGEPATDGEPSSSDGAGVDDDGGCGCRSTRTSPLAALLLLLARRRRRR